MVEADRPRAGDAPVCASSAQCLAHARWPCDTFEHVGCGAADGWRCLGQASRPAVSSVSLLLSCDSAFRRETRTELAMPTPSSIRPQPVRRDAQSPITSCGCSASTPAGTRRKREQRFRQRLGHGGRPRSAHQMPTTSTPTSRSRASCSPQDNGHYRDDALASRGRCGRRLLLGWTDPLGCGRQFLGPRRARSQGRKEQRFALCSLNPRCPAAWIGAARLAVDPQWRALLPVAMRLCTETFANLCKNDIVVFPERPRPACR